MKVVKPGFFFFADGVLCMRQWLFDFEGRRFANADEAGGAMLATALCYLGERYGVTVMTPDPTERASADVERLTQDVIAVCRWPEQEPKR